MSDLISREAAAAAANYVVHDCNVLPGTQCAICETAIRIEAAIRALTSIAPDPSVADAAWKNILFLIDGPSPRWTHGYNVWQATLLREIRTFARAARDAR